MMRGIYCFRKFESSKEEMLHWMLWFHTGCGTPFHTFALDVGFILRQALYGPKLASGNSDPRITH